MISTSIASTGPMSTVAACTLTIRPRHVARPPIDHRHTPRVVGGSQPVGADRDDGPRRVRVQCEGGPFRNPNLQHSHVIVLEDHSMSIGIQFSRIRGVAHRSPPLAAAVPSGSTHETASIGQPRAAQRSDMSGPEAAISSSHPPPSSRTSQPKGNCPARDVRCITADFQRGTDGGCVPPIGKR